MQDILQFLKEQMKDNQFLQGGLVLGLVGSAIVYLRHLPVLVYRWIKFLLTVTVTFESRDPLFDFFKQWTNDQEFIYKKRNVMVSTNEHVDPPVIRQEMGRSRYVLRMHGFWLTVSRYRDEAVADKKADRMSFSQLMNPEMITVTCFVWNRKKLVSILDEVIDSYGSNVKFGVPTYQFGYWSWVSSGVQSKRDVDSLVLREGLKEEILRDVEDFYASKEWYDRLHIPHQRGYLLKGPPGTGKTSLVGTMAGFFNLKLCPLELGSIDDDSTLRRAFTNVPGRAIIVIEDFDSFFEGRKPKNPDSKITFSGLLNAVNGIIHSPGRLLVLTTNRVENIDPALSRVGRIDRIFELGYVDEYQAGTLLRKFDPRINEDIVDDFAKRCAENKLTPADLLGYFQMCKNDPERVIDVEAIVEERRKRDALSEEIDREAELQLKEQRRREAETKPEVSQAGVHHGRPV